MNKKKKDAPLSIFTNFGIKTLLVISSLILGGLGLQVFNNNYLDKECTSSSEKSVCRFVYPYIKEMSISLVTSGITILFLEILLKKESIKELEKIFKASEATSSIKAFYPRLNLYKGYIQDNIEQASKGQQIKMLGLASLELDILQEVGRTKLIEKICLQGCNLQIMLLHPDSSLLKCVENLGHDRSREEITGIVHRVFRTFFNDLTEYVNKHQLEGKVSGSIEVRMHKDIFSPIFYYSGEQLDIIGLYCTVGTNTEHPAFDIIDRDYKKELDKHFEGIWDKSNGRTMLRWNISGSTSRNEVLTIFPQAAQEKNAPI
jgi:hypothetical protein